VEAAQAAVAGPRGPLDRVAEALAAFGGFCLLAVMAVEMVSVGGGLFGKPLLGDSEIIEMLCGVAIACFMPYCQLRGGNVIVDFFTMRLPAPARDALDAVMHLVVAVVVAILTWKLIDGALTQHERGRTSMFLQLPQWWGYALASVAAVVWTVACCATCWQRLRAALGGRPGGA
jgi:TRAP-type C4-dicarboxylate transport system permease small subunit